MTETRGNRNRPELALEAAGDRWQATISTIDHFQRRVVQDALNEARRAWWLKRAEDFERAKPRPEDYNGRATLEELRARWRWCHQVAEACRNKAALVPLTLAEFEAEVEAIFDEEAA